ncbi:MAG: RraA family protein [Acetivibrionales bacterium]|jgi:regulator of RNase E activity RraA
MGQSFRIYQTIKRVDRAILDRFSGLPVANIADNMGRIACLDHSLVPFNNTPLLGTAFTVKAPAGDNLMFHKALDLAQPGDVLVVAANGYKNRSLCGGIMASYAKKKGLAGFIIDGAIRDKAEISKMDFPVYARSVQPNGPYKNGPGCINVPVSCAGQVIFPGDILVGDEDGIVVIRPDEAEEILEAAWAQNAMENRSFEEIEAGCYDRSWVDRVLKEKGCEIID